MHAFALVLVSIMAHTWAKSLVSMAQRVVTYFRASHKPLATLQRIAASRKIRTTLVSSNKTRLTSMHLCIQSLIQLQPAFSEYLEQAKTDATLMPAAQQELKDALSDFAWWANLQRLEKVMKPFSEVIMAIQSYQATLADVSRYWLYLAQQMKLQLPFLPADFRKHVIAAFNKRAAEMDSGLCRLALFLDPRFKDLMAYNSESLKDISKQVGVKPLAVRVHCCVLRVAYSLLHASCVIHGALTLAPACQQPAASKANQVRSGRVRSGPRCCMHHASFMHTAVCRMPHQVTC